MPHYQWNLFEANLDLGEKVKKPVLVVSNEKSNQAMPDVTVLPLISVKRKLSPSEVLLQKGVAGQSMDSIILAGQMRSIPKEQLGEIQGSVDDEAVRRQVVDAIKEHLDIE